MITDFDFFCWAVANPGGLANKMLTFVFFFVDLFSGVC